MLCFEKYSTYEVDGKSYTIDYGEIPQGLEFEGTITKNGEQSCEITMEVKVHTSDIAEFDISVGFDLEDLGITDEEEKDFCEDLERQFQEYVVDAYHWPTGQE